LSATINASPWRRAPEEHVDVAGMQEVEDAVREHDASLLRRAPARRVGPIVDL
jgi:hypothetical protein